MHQIGEWVWRATLKHRQVEVICPDCFGRRALRVILGDDSEVVINCAGCTLGYEPPRGYVHEDRVEATVEHVQINRIEAETNNGVPITFYGGSGFYRESEEDLFLNAETAQVRAEALQLEHEQEQLASIRRKEKTTRDWAWHVTYHRKGIKQAQRDLEWHTAKLAVAIQNKRS